MAEERKQENEGKKKEKSGVAEFLEEGGDRKGEGGGETHSQREEVNNPDREILS